MISKKISIFFSIVLLVSLLLWGVVFNLKKPRILVLHSYDTDYSWTRGVNTGLKRVFEKYYDVSIRWHYMDTKKHSDKESIARAGLVAVETIENWEPDVIIAVDNHAQEYAARFYANKPDISIVFAGINGSITKYGYHRAYNVTGIRENRSIEPMCSLINDIEKEKGNKRKVRLRYLLDSSSSVLSDRRQIDDLNWEPFIYTGSFPAKTFGEWKSLVLSSEGKTDYIFVTNYRKLRISKKSLSMVSPFEVMKWTEENSPVPVIGLQVFNVEDGGMLAVGVSPFEQGEIAGDMAIKITLQNINASDIPVADNKHFIISMRKSAMEKRNIKLPPIYESFSRATANYYK